MINLRHARTAQHESGHAVAALFYSLPLLEVVVDADGSGCARYTRHFGVGKIECWVVSAFCGPEAELDRFGSAPVTADFDVIEEMARRLGGLTWTPPRRSRAAGSGGVPQRRQNATPEAARGLLRALVPHTQQLSSSTSRAFVASAAHHFW